MTEYILALVYYSAEGFAINLCSKNKTEAELGCLWAEATILKCLLNFAEVLILFFI